MNAPAKLICGMAAMALLAGCANDYNHRDRDRDRDHRGDSTQDRGDRSGDHNGDRDNSGPR